MKDKSKTTFYHFNSKSITMIMNQKKKKLLLPMMELQLSNLIILHKILIIVKMNQEKENFSNY